MERSVASGVATCSVCGQSLNSRGECLACLIRAALEESITEDGPKSLVFGDFKVVRRDDGSLFELGHGAMGATYLAVDNVLRRKVALKLIELPQAARTSQAVHERFLREARAAACLRHPNVAAVFQFGASPSGRHCYYAMELIEGETLQERVQRDGPLSAKLVLEIGMQTVRALTAAAAQGLIHRDLKPGNIMLTRGDADTAEVTVKVIDFGLAKAIADAGSEMDLTGGGFVGTPNFASPEQFESGPIDVRADIYSLGVTLWFALTGKMPFVGRSIEEIRSAQKSNALHLNRGFFGKAFACREFLRVVSWPEELMDEPLVSRQRVTELLVQWSDGDNAALAELTPLAYEELRRVGHRHPSGQRLVQRRMVRFIHGGGALSFQPKSHAAPWLYAKRGEESLTFLTADCADFRF
jgi:serine/threonine protein kinase